MKMWPTCTKEGLEQHKKEYEFRLEQYVNSAPPTAQQVSTVYDKEKDTQINIDTDAVRIETLDHLIKVCTQEIKDFDSSS